MLFTHPTVHLCTRGQSDKITLKAARLPSLKYLPAYRLALIGWRLGLSNLDNKKDNIKGYFNHVLAKERVQLKKY